MYGNTIYFTRMVDEDMGQHVLFYDASFPYAGQRPDERALADLKRRFVVADAKQLAEALKDADVYVHLHGPFFPKDAWTAILNHLRRGGGLLSAGGAPFKTPVCKVGGEWIAEPEQTGYHQQLLIHDALAVDPSRVERLAANPDIPLLEGCESLFTVEPTLGLVLHVTRASDWPEQMGSGGPMDARIEPLLKGIGRLNGIEREVAAPVVQLEHVKGAFCGGRWIFVNQQLRGAFWDGGGAEALAKWAAYAALGVTELWLKPNYGSYEPGEQASFTLQGQRFERRDFGAKAAVRGGAAADAPVAWSFRLRVLKANRSSADASAPDYRYDSDAFTEVWSASVELPVGLNLALRRLTMPVPLSPGFYVAECAAESAAGERRTLRQGFWGFDRELLREGDMLRCGRDYFVKGGKPLPIVGMTYMTSDVARKYLFLPNAAVWDRDMAQMKRAGINLIRTGIWTAWRNIMFVDGHPYEEVLRAIDAFLLTAKRHGLDVTFNFFSFTPETWEGVNPYLDPRSVEAQKRFLTTIVSRHADSTHVHWDLINEPSLFDPKRTFSGPRSARDPYERQAYIEWLRERHGDIRTLQERWNMTPDELPSFEAVRLPEPGDVNFRTTPLNAKKNGVWLDYTLFTMDMHNRWARELTAAIRAIQPQQLVTVGQDEALAAQRPSPFFYSEAVDYTTVHSWWEMDDLVWDGVFTKTLNKPNLVQETGIMHVETPDGRSKRSEEELRNILERKYAYAFATGAAGAVQWIWNINYYMDNVNESNIGALRADGTEKPEADVSYDFGSFMARIGELFKERRLEEIAVVFPYSNDFSVRKLAREATSRLVRTLAYTMNIHVRGAGEYHLDELEEAPPKLVIVPSPHNFGSDALSKLIGLAERRGTTLLFTGPIGLDEYWRPVNRLNELLGPEAGPVVNLRREELLELNGRLLPVSFGGPHIADSAKQLTGGSEDGPARLIERQLGAGKLLWCPLPLELNERLEPLQAVYRLAADAAGVERELEWLRGGELPGVYGRKVGFAEGALYVFVSEAGYPVDVEVRDPGTGKRYAFTLEAERSVLFACGADGGLTAVYRPHEVRIAVFG